jgi:RNA polymerase sigma factor (sigma-70 family)
MSLVGRGIVLRQIDRLFGEGTLIGLGDGQLLERYLSRRDEDAFEALVDRLGPMVLGHCRRVLRDPRDIEDAFQATFLVLVRKAPSIRDRELLSSWLYGVAYRVARRARARTLRRRDREAPVGVPEVAAEPEPQQTEIDPMLDQELNRLPERYRAPMVLCYLRGRTHEQAAEDLRCPVGTVRSRLARGRDLLRKRLTRRGFAPSAMAGLLGSDPASMARLLVADVPPSMAAAAVRAAVGFASSSSFKAGAAAASSVALARGVLTTMKLAQLKWIGLAAMATGLSAGSVVAVGSAPAPRNLAEPAPRAAPQDKGETRPPTDDVDSLKAKVESLTKDNDLKKAQIASLTDQMLQLREDRAKERDTLTMQIREWRDRAERGAVRSPSPERPADPTDTRLKALEDKLDQLLSRSGTPSALDSAEALGSQLDSAIKQNERIEELAKRQAVSANEADLARNRVRVIMARVQAFDREAQEELERLRLERLRKSAMLEKAQAEVEVAAAVVARNDYLNKRKPDMVAADEVTKARAQLKVANAASKIAEVDVAEVDLRIDQLKRKAKGIQDVIQRAVLAKDLK